MCLWTWWGFEGSQQPVAFVMQAELDMSGWPRNWQAAVQRVLESVLKLPEAAPFAEPVPVDEVPGYRELVPHPMDLTTVLVRSKADNYDTPLEALADVRQVGIQDLVAWCSCCASGSLGT